MRWHLAKKRWAKSRSEFFYDLRQNIKTLQKAVKHFFVKSKHERNTKSKAPVYSVTILLVAVGIAYSSYKAAPKVWAQFKANELYTASQESLALNNKEQAFWNAYTSYHYEMRGHRYENLRILAHTAHSIGHFETIRFLGELAHHEKANPDDSILYIRSALDRNLHDLASEHFQVVSHLSETRPEVLLIQLRIQAKNWRGNYDQVLETSRELVHEHKIKDPALDEIYLNIALRTKDYSKEAVAYLFQLTQRNDQSALIALRNAVQPRAFNKFSPEQTGGFLFDYLKHPLATKGDRIFAFAEAFKMQLIPHSELETFLAEEFQTESPANLGREELFMLFDFLKDINLPHKILGIVPPEVATRDKLFLLDYMMTLNNSGKLKESFEIIENSSSMFSKSEKFLLRGINRMFLDEQDKGGAGDSSQSFSGILGEAAQANSLPYGAQDNHLDYLFDLGLHKAGPEEFPVIEHLYDWMPHKDQLKAYLQKVSTHPFHGNTAKVLLLRLFKEIGEEEGIMEILENAELANATLNPRDLELVLYLKALYGMDPEGTLLMLEQESSKDGTPMDMVIDLSLAYYLANQPAKAFRTLEEVFPHHHLFRRPGSRVISALVYDANQQPESNLFLQTLNIESLLPPERKLVSRLLQANALDKGAN